MNVRREELFGQLVAGIEFEKATRPEKRAQPPPPSTTAAPIPTKSKHKSKKRRPNVTGVALFRKGEETEQQKRQEDENRRRLAREAELERAAALRKQHGIRVSSPHSSPTPIASFSELEQSVPELLGLVNYAVERGYADLTPIQMQAIPALYTGRDVVGIAPTGSGKTLAFLLPLLAQARKQKASNALFGLVVSPTCELSAQTYHTFHTLQNSLEQRHPVSAFLLDKGSKKRLKKMKPAILFTTPYALMQQIQNGALDVSHVKYLILDEADRLFSMEKTSEKDMSSLRHYVSQLDAIVAACQDKDLVRALFSATLPPHVSDLAHNILVDPVSITVGKKNVGVPSVEQHLVYAGSERGKLLAIRQIFAKGLLPPVVIFVDTRERANALLAELRLEGITLAGLHSEMEIHQRNKILQRFQNGEIWVLVATDLVSRGIDFVGVNLVVNYDFPKSTTDYIHRIGRTGRAGNPGKSYTFFTDSDRGFIRPIANTIREAGGTVPDWMTTLKKDPWKNKCDSIDTQPPCGANLIDWPEGRRPKSGNVTRSALSRLRVADLKQELNKRALTATGNKPQLVEELLTAVQQQCQQISTPNEAAPQQNRLHRLPTPLDPKRFEDIWVDGEIPDSINPEASLELLEWLSQNATGLQFVFLGTSSWIPTPSRGLPSVALRTRADIWLFDAGEDTQRQCMKHPLLRPGKISRIFLTSLSGDVVFGVPGLLCSIAASRDQGAANSLQPVHVYGPLGTGDFVADIMELSDTFLEMPVIVHEFSKQPCPRQLITLIPRAKLWKMELAPDGLCEDGYYDARLDAKTPLKKRVARRGRRSSFLNTVDGRAGFRPFDLPPPGDPSRYPLPREELKWTLWTSEEFLLTVYEIDDVTGALGYRIEEASRAGNLDIDRAIALGIQPGKEYGALKSGRTVKNPDGEDVTPDMVLSPDRPGRTIAILGEPSNAERCLPVTKNAHYLILPVGQDPVDKAGWTPQQALSLAESAHVHHLIFSRTHTEYPLSTPPLSEAFFRDPEMGHSCDSGSDLAVTSAFDLYTHVLPNVQHRV